jgi:hypothetical protein
VRPGVVPGFRRLVCRNPIIWFLEANTSEFHFYLAHGRITGQTVMVPSNPSFIIQAAKDFVLDSLHGPQETFLSLYSAMFTLWCLFRILSKALFLVDWFGFFILSLAWVI